MSYLVSLMYYEFREYWGLHKSRFGKHVLLEKVLPPIY